jgi:hypothetical protein
LVDDSQIILFNTIKYYERGKRMKNRSLGEGTKLGCFTFSLTVSLLFLFFACVKPKNFFALKKKIWEENNQREKQTIPREGG